jgi:hypothetical protein
MEYKDNLPVKYLTDTYRLIDGYPRDSGDVVITIVQAIRSSRKIKKSWCADDYVFSSDLFLQNFDMEVLDDCISCGLVLKKSDGVLYFSNDGLGLIFKA